MPKTKTPRQTRKLSPFFLLPFTLFLILLFSLPWARAKEPPKPKPQPWEIEDIVAALDSNEGTLTINADRIFFVENENKSIKIGVKKLPKTKPQFWEIEGIVAALDDSHDIVKADAFRQLASYEPQDLKAVVKKPEDIVRKAANILKDQKMDASVRSRAAEALGNLGETAKPYIPDLLNILKDQKVDASVRGSAAEAIGNLGETAKPYIPDLLNILKDQKVDASVRGSAAEAIGNLGEAAKPYIPDLLNILKDQKVDASVRGSAAQTIGNLGETAKPYIPDLLNILKDQKVNVSVRDSAAEAIGNLGEAAKPYIPDLANILKDQKMDASVRGSAAQTIGNLGEAAKPYIPDLLNILKDEKVNAHFRGSATQALRKIRKLELNEVVLVLDRVYELNQQNINFERWRFLTYFLSGGTDEVKTLLKWVGYPQALPTQLKYEEAKKTLEVFRDAWAVSQGLERLQQDLANKIAEVARKVSWKPQDIPLLQTHYNNLKKSGHNTADTVQSAINAVTLWKWFSDARNTILIHAAFWLALIFAYPKFPQVQAIFFWNPWVRKILGWGYVGFLLTWVPYLRRKLFEPFKPSLLADAGLDNFTSLTYFPESKVKVPGSEEIKPITEPLLSIQGQIVLEGDSGLGKSMFLRHLVNHSPRLVVYLPAQKCDQGIIEAIQAKLHGQAQDAEFLKNLIYSGAIDICIDGLNEVTADTRAKITQFVECYFRGNIIMTTQPLEWTPPSTAKIYTLQPLERDQIQLFLVSRQPRLPKDAKIQRADYEKACTSYLIDALNPQQPPEDLAAAQRTVSNPMDLSLVALMLSQGKTPDLFRLQEQQYKQMAEEFLREWKYEFPLKKFSQAVYQMRLNDEKAVPVDAFYQELQSLEDEKYKMLVSRQWKDEKGEAKKEWYFRHDKIMDFFLVQNFLGKRAEAETRLIDHMGDPRFRGVYFLLATLLPLDEAKELREKLIQYAADSKDHTVSDTFVQLLRTR
ncbi:HEAT repeat domain-containing protein [Trichocoleus sp. FACHB-832]|uniref:HEAT repeat domain-containing protein n=1 Tax=Trichocoleus sp. FACHB-832 TaxID=2692875 RepID=UPI00168A3BFE|nr:HEAT repeat domain-containing protein [Trichocoleus sp. FACHB-832]MBD1906451.1 HEAT repeat domain-containing protein [Trichocoleus sp. FACHB-832]